MSYDLITGTRARGWLVTGVLLLIGVNAPWGQAYTLMSVMDRPCLELIFHGPRMTKTGPGMIAVVIHYLLSNVLTTRCGGTDPMGWGSPCSPSPLSWTHPSPDPSPTWPSGSKVPGNHMGIVGELSSPSNKTSPPLSHWPNGHPGPLATLSCPPIGHPSQLTLLDRSEINNKSVV